MLEALTTESLRERLGLLEDGNGRPAVANVAHAARSCVRNWGSPPRARVTAFLHRQLAAAAFEEEPVRERVRDVVDALIEIGDFTSVRLDGSACLVLSRPTIVHIAASEFALLGQWGEVSKTLDDPWRYARAVRAPAAGASPIDFSDWLGPAGFRTHLARRADGARSGTIREYWAVLVAALRHEGSPIDPAVVRAVSLPPDHQRGYFGRHALPVVEGRWTAGSPEGIWCAVRPGRNANEWHPILIEASGERTLALDLFNWDEWNWAFLARASAIGPAERSEWTDGVLAFQHPVPAQFIRAMRLLGGPGEQAWQWRISEAAMAAFATWRSAEL